LISSFLVVSKSYSYVWDDSLEGGSTDIKCMKLTVSVILCLGCRDRTWGLWKAHQS